MWFVKQKNENKQNLFFKIVQKFDFKFEVA